MVLHYLWKSETAQSSLPTHHWNKNRKEAWFTWRNVDTLQEGSQVELSTENRQPVESTITRFPTSWEGRREK